jgi:hypothetical protein
MRKKLIIIRRLWRVRTPGGSPKIEPYQFNSKTVMWLFQSKSKSKSKSNPKPKPIVETTPTPTPSLTTPEKSKILTGKEFRELYPGTMVKIMRKDFTHHGYTFQNGLNVLSEDFNPNFRKGGFHFTNSAMRYFDYGELFVEVEVPEDAKVVVMKPYLFKTNKIIIKMETQDLIQNAYYVTHNGKQINIFEVTDVESFTVETRKLIEDWLKFLIDYYSECFDVSDFDFEAYCLLKPFYQYAFRVFPSLIIYALDMGGIYFTCIDQPTTEITLYALKKYPYLISFVKNPTLEMLTIYCLSCNNLKYPFFSQILSTPPKSESESTPPKSETESESTPPKSESKSESESTTI